jgi:hypothetical protein
MGPVLRRFNAIQRSYFEAGAQSISALPDIPDAVKLVEATPYHAPGSLAGGVGTTHRNGIDELVPRTTGPNDNDGKVSVTEPNVVTTGGRHALPKEPLGAPTEISMQVAHHPKVALRASLDNSKTATGSTKQDAMAVRSTQGDIFGVAGSALSGVDGSKSGNGNARSNAVGNANSTVAQTRQ